MLRRAPALLSALLTVAAAAVLVAAWPARLGGPFSYVVTHGVSMEPRFHSGDLALVHRAGTYRVGDVAAYRNVEFHSTVLHRIVAEENGRFVFQGDNNWWRDKDRPAEADILGRLWVRIPQGGRVLGWASSPGVLGLLGGLVIVSGGRTRTRRGRRKRAGSGGFLGAARGRAESPGSLGSLSAGDGPTLLAQLAAPVGLALVLVSVAGYAVQGERTGRQVVARPQALTVSYAADVKNKTVYPDGRVSMPQPVYTRLADRLDLPVSYWVRLPAGSDVSGTLSVDAELTAPNGWRRSFSALDGKDFDWKGDSPDDGWTVSATGDLDLDQLDSVIDKLTRATGTSRGTYDIAVTVSVELAGTVSGQPVKDLVTAKLPLVLTETQIGPAPALTTGQAAVETHSSLPVTSVTTSPREVHVAGHGVGLRRLQLVGLTLGLLLLGGAGALVTLARRRRAGGEASATLRRHRGRIVEAQAALIPTSRTVLTLDSIGDLVRIAERYDRFIVHRHAGSEHSFMVDDETALYLHTVTSAVTSTVDRTAAAGPTTVTTPEPVAAPYVPEPEAATGAAASEPPTVPLQRRRDREPAGEPRVGPMARKGSPAQRARSRHRVADEVPEPLTPPEGGWFGEHTEPAEQPEAPAQEAVPDAPEASAEEAAAEAYQTYSEAPPTNPVPKIPAPRDTSLTDELLGTAPTDDES